MNAQQYLDVIIRPTLEDMSQHGNYNSYNSRMLMLATVAIESDMGRYNQQVGGPAISGFQLEPPTIFDVARHWDAYPKMTEIIRKISGLYRVKDTNLALECEVNQRLACLIARGKYAMDTKRLPEFDEPDAIYAYYKRVYNSNSGASTPQKFKEAWKRHKLDEVNL